MANYSTPEFYEQDSLDPIQLRKALIEGGRRYLHPGFYADSNTVGYTEYSFTQTSLSVAGMAVASFILRPRQSTKGRKVAEVIKSLEVHIPLNRIDLVTPQPGIVFLEVETQGDSMQRAITGTQILPIDLKRSVVLDEHKIAPVILGYESLDQDGIVEPITGYATAEELDEDIAVLRVVQVGLWASAFALVPQQN